MICGVFGLPGSGKTLLASWLCSRAIAGKSINVHGFNCGAFDKQYSRVYTNFPAVGAYKLDFETLGFCEYKNCLMICDELQIFADSRNYKNFGENLREFFSEHRKDKIDFIWLTQAPDMADKRIRSLTDRIYKLDMLFGKIINPISK